MQDINWVAVGVIVTGLGVVITGITMTYQIRLSRKALDLQIKASESREEELKKTVRLMVDVMRLHFGALRMLSFMKDADPGSNLSKSRKEMEAKFKAFSDNNALDIELATFGEESNTKQN